jgi:hypothetical protein
LCCTRTDENFDFARKIYLKCKKFASVGLGYRMLSSLLNLKHALTLSGDSPQFALCHSAEATQIDTHPNKDMFAVTEGRVRAVGNRSRRTPYARSAHTHDAADWNFTGTRGELRKEIPDKYDVFGTYPAKPKPTHVKRCI